MSELEQLKALLEQARQLGHKIDCTFTNINGRIVGGNEASVLRLMNRVYFIENVLEGCIDALEGKL